MSERDWAHAQADAIVTAMVADLVERDGGRLLPQRATGLLRTRITEALRAARTHYPAPTSASLLDRATLIYCSEKVVGATFQPSGWGGAIEQALEGERECRRVEEEQG